MNCIYERRLGQLPGEGVLAAAIADEEDAQGRIRHFVCVFEGDCKGVALPKASRVTSHVSSFGHCTLIHSQKFPRCGVDRLWLCSLQMAFAVTSISRCLNHDVSEAFLR